MMISPLAAVRPPPRTSCGSCGGGRIASSDRHQNERCPTAKAICPRGMLFFRVSCCFFAQPARPNRPVLIDGTRSAGLWTLVPVVNVGRSAAPTSMCYRLGFKFNANSMSRRAASDRDGLSGCFCAQSSTRAINSLGARIGSTGSMPVAGRPRFFVARKLSLTRFIFFVYEKLRDGGKLALPTGPNPSQGGSHGSG